MRPKAVSLSEMVRTEFSPRLEQLGFELRTPRRGVWMHVRTLKLGFEQIVTLYRDRHIPNSLHCDFGTTDVQHLGSAESLVQRRLLEDWKYTDEGSLRLVLGELLHITIEHGLPTMERNGGPFPKTTEENAGRLLSGPENWAAAFAREYGLAVGEPEDLNRVEALVIEAKRQSVEPNWDLLLGAAAFLGELIRSAVGGKWIWEEYKKTPGLSVRIGFVYPLIRLAEYWAKESPGYLTSYYRFFVERG